MTYEMLVGEPPHIGNSVQAIVAKILSERPSPITQTRDMVPGNVDAAVNRALAKSPADRFTSAAKFASALSDATFTLPTMSGPTTVGAPRKEGVSIRSFAAVSALAIVLLVTTIIGWTRAEPPQPVSRYNVSLPDFQSLDQNLVGSRFTLTADGDRLIYVGDEGGPGRLYVRSRNSLAGTPLSGTEGGFSPKASPDGSRVAFLTQISGTVVQVVSLVGGPPIEAADSGLDIQGVSWSSDGQHLYAVAQGAGRVGPGLVRMPAGGGGPLQVVTRIDSTRDEIDHMWPSALPNGKGVLFQVLHGNNLADTDIAVVDLETGEHRYLVRGSYAVYATSGHLVYVTIDGTLMARPFDQDNLELTGEPRAWAEGLGGRFAGAADLSVSATGTLIYATGAAANVQPVWVTRDGSATAIDPDWSGAMSYPELSPSGVRLAISIAQDNVVHLWVKRLDRGPSTILTHEGSLNFRTSWVRDGSALAFISDRGISNDIYFKRADGSSQAERLLTAIDDLPPVWEIQFSSDGAWIVYRVETESSDIYAVRSRSDSAPVGLLTTDASERMPVLSPDGRWLSYMSSMSGNNEVYVRPFPNVDDWMQQVSTAGGVAPKWSPRGDELFYRNGANEMVAVAIDRSSGSTFQWTEQTTLFSVDGFRTAENRHEYDVAPDGERFVFLRFMRDADPTEIIIVENWFEELKERVGND
jgi:serine/threonine-protein kinase